MPPVILSMAPTAILSSEDRCFCRTDSEEPRRGSEENPCNELLLLWILLLLLLLWLWLLLLL